MKYPGYKFHDEKGEHLHTLDDKPLLGTSTVLGVLAKPLTWWASGLAVGELGWTKITDPRTRRPFPIEPRLEAAAAKLAEIKELPVEEYLALLDKAYAAHSKTLNKAAQDGTDMHAELEAYVKWCIDFHAGVPQEASDALNLHTAVGVFAKWSIENLNRFIASEAHCFSRELWTGGIVDLIAELKDGSTIILDFKSAKDAYVSHFLQDAGYDIALSENGIFDANGTRLGSCPPIAAYAVLPFGMDNPVPFFRRDTEELKAGFKACVELHKLINLPN